MNTAEAKAILKNRLDHFRTRSYEELAAMVGSITTEEATGASGAAYQLEIEFRWDAKPNANVHVMGSIDDGGLRAFLPLTDDFVKSPSGRLVGE